MGINFRIAARILPDKGAAAHDLRLSPRTPVTFVIPLRAIGLEGNDAVIRDLSAEGFMAETDGPLIPGETARLQLPEIGTVSARVIWAGDGKIGGKFDHPLSDGPLFRLVELGSQDLETFADEEQARPPFIPIQHEE